MARRIIGTVSAPINLSTLVATAFIYYKELYFRPKDTGLNDLVEIKPKALFADNIIRTLNNKFRSLKAQGLWSTSEGKKLYMEGELAGLNLAMNKLV